MIRNNYYRNFWDNGNGKDFLKWSKAEISVGKYDVSLFNTYDKKVDKLVGQWIDSGEFKFIMKSLHGNDKIENLPQDYINLRHEIEVLPNWIDKDILNYGCQLSNRTGLIGLLILRDFALMGGYIFSSLTKPLIATGALEKGAVHRLYNTLNFWIKISNTGPDAEKMRLDACLSTRLIHSASRLMIQKKIPDYNLKKYGVPINFADIIATNIAFTIYFLFGLSKLSFKFSREEEQGIFHLWQYNTFLLGVPYKIIPSNRLEALRFFKFWTNYQAEPDEDGLKLAESLLEEDTQLSLLKFNFIKKNMKNIHTSVANYLIDSKIKEHLKIPESRYQSMVIKALKIKNKFANTTTKQILRGRAEQISVLEDYKNNMKHNSYFK